MRLTALLTTLTILMAPSLAMAECGWGHKINQSAASCADGQTWDSSAQACVDKTTS